MSIFGKIVHGVESAGKAVASGASSAAKTVASGAETAGKAVASGAETAGKTAVKGVSTVNKGLTTLMYPDIPGKKRDLENLVNRYNAQRKSMGDSYRYFKSVLQTYKQMTACNSALLISLMVLKMSDSEFEKYLIDVDKNPFPSQPNRQLPAEIADSIVKFAGGYFTLKAIYNFGKLIKQIAIPKMNPAELTEIDTMSTDIAAAEIGEAGAEVGTEAGAEVAIETSAEAAGELMAEGAAEAGLAETGAGVLVALGLAAVFSAIDGAKEEHQLNEALSKMRDSLNKVDTSLDNINKAIDEIKSMILKEEDRFFKIMELLSPIIQPTFTWQYTLSVSTAASICGAMYSAMQEYGFLNRARLDWVNYLKNTKKHGHQPNWEIFVTKMVERKDLNLTEDQARALLEILKSHSESMQIAVAKNQ